MIAVKYKFEKIVEELRALIGDGTYHDRLPSIRVMAEKFGVNNRTVLKAVEQLEAERLVHTDSTRGVTVTRERAQRARSGIINIIYPSNFSPGVRVEDNDFIRELTGLFAARGYRTVVTMQCEDIMTDRMYWANNPCDGYVLISFKEKEAFPWHRIISKLQLPAVYFCNILPMQKNYNWVDFDNIGIMRELFSRLLAGGHRRIAYFEANHASAQHNARVACYQEFLQEHGISLPAAPVDGIIDETITERAELNRIHRQLVADYARSLLASGEPPTAVYLFFAHPEPLIEVFREQGLEPGRDYKIILKRNRFSRESSPSRPAEPADPRFLTISGDYSKASEAIVRKLLCSMENPRESLAGELIPMELDFTDNDLMLH
jgi:DNA-binding LacI/PurR family transcriptional regulator